MKQTYYLLILLLMSLVSCENRHIKHYDIDLYFYNELENDITLEIFKGGEVSKYELTQNDSVFWTTFHWYCDDRKIHVESETFVAYQEFLYPIDSVKMHYKKIYTYSDNDSINGLFYLQGQNMDIIYFGESKKENFGWK